MNKNTSFKLPLVILASLICAMMTTSCATEEERCYNSFNGFVDEVEQSAPDLSAEDWAAYMEMYEMYEMELTSFEHNYTPEQNQEIGRLKARYHKVVMKHYADEAVNFIDNFSNQMEGYLDVMLGDEDSSY